MPLNFSYLALNSITNSCLSYASYFQLSRNSISIENQLSLCTLEIIPLHCNLPVYISSAASYNLLIKNAHLAEWRVTTPHSLCATCRRFDPRVGHEFVYS